jgi:ketosteroid isomerase-like protein
MYHLIVRRKLLRAFDAINRGEYAGIVAQFAPRHRHVMHGAHALGGERHSLARTAQWYARLQRLLPDLRFTVHSVVVAGWPWDTHASVGWTDTFTLPDGSRGSNQGVHEFTLRWGRVHALSVHCDTARLQGLLPAHVRQRPGRGRCPAHRRRRRAGQPRHRHPTRLNLQKAPP